MYSIVFKSNCLNCVEYNFKILAIGPSYWFMFYNFWSTNLKLKHFKILFQYKIIKTLLIVLTFKSFLIVSYDLIITILRKNGLFSTDVKLTVGDEVTRLFNFNYVIFS